MRKIIAISFLFIYACATTELGQVLKLPVLVQHFIKHKQEDKTITFFAFLNMHYAHGDVKDADYDEDMKLPFKTCNGTCDTNIAVYIPSEIIAYKLENFKAYYTSIRNGFKPFYNTYNMHKVVWQPPRV